MTEEFTRPLPADLDAERLVLSGMLDNPQGITAAAAALAGGAEDFSLPAHRVVYAAITAMHASGDPVSVPPLADAIIAAGDARALGGRPKEFLFDLWHLGGGSTWPWQLVASNARTVRDRAIRRRMIEAATRLEQWARTLPDTDDLAGSARAEIDAVVDYSGDGLSASGRVRPLLEFMDDDHHQPDPVIPGLLNHLDRVVVTGPSGSGKSTLGFQVGFAAAVGAMPFGGADRYPPARTLIIDLENPAYLLDQTLEPVWQAAAAWGDPWDQIQIIHLPRGVDLARRSDSARLAGMIRKAAPDLIVAGPVYKMHGDTGDRGEHTMVMDWWDMIRDRHAPALWLETHPAKGRFGKVDWTPGGSARWGGWPEIGFAMVPTKTDGEYEVRGFRGLRDRKRRWPVKLRTSLSGGWPWDAEFPPQTLGS